MGQLSLGRDEIGSFYADIESVSTQYLDKFEEGSKFDRVVRLVDAVYANEETGYGVYRVEDEEHHWFNISGTFVTSPALNAYYRVIGTVSVFRGEKQIRFSSIVKSLPKNEEGIITVLRSLHGLDSKAHLLYEYFGPDILDIIKKDPLRLVTNIKGVGEKRALLWQQQLTQSESMNDAMLKLISLGVSSSKARAIFQKYGGEAAIEQIRTHPYFLINEIQNFGFHDCDKIALANDYPFDGIERIKEAMMYVLRRAMMEGDCYVEAEEFYGSVQRLVNIYVEEPEYKQLVKQYGPAATISYLVEGVREVQLDLEDVTKKRTAWKKNETPFRYPIFEFSDKQIENLVSMSQSILQVVSYEMEEVGLVYQLQSIAHAEEDIAKRIYSLRQSFGYGPDLDPGPVLREYLKRKNIVLEEKQMEAVLTIASGRGGFFILNGPAGCGKTFTLRIILDVLEELYRMDGRSFHALLMAPTGKAAKVASSATGMDAKTIHRSLGLVSTSGQSDVMINREDCVIIDETSMVDVNLAGKLLNAIGDAVKVVFLGDVEQLPSIGPGLVLKNLIESGLVPTITLNVVKRQSEQSGILKNANKILAGENIQQEIINKDDQNGNAYIIRKPSPARCRDSIVEFYTKQIESGRYSLQKIQVLCPQKNSDVGTNSINYYIQQMLNPLKPGDIEVKYTAITIHDSNGQEAKVDLCFRTGDKVLHTKNDYNKQWYYLNERGYLEPDIERIGIINGEVGVIRQIHNKGTEASKKPVIIVEYDDGFVMYEEDWSSLQLAYAMTIHKSQGSQWPLVIGPIMDCNAFMLNRNILYTFYTRAQETSVIFGQESAIARAIRNINVTRRKTTLVSRMRHYPH